MQPNRAYKLQKRLAKEVGMLSIGMALTTSSEVLGIGMIAVTTASGALLLHEVLHVGVHQFFCGGILLIQSSLFSKSIQVCNRKIFKSYAISHIRIIRMIGAPLMSHLEVYLDGQLIMNICHGR